MGRSCEDINTIIKDKMEDLSGFFPLCPAWHPMQKEISLD